MLLSNEEEGERLFQKTLLIQQFPDVHFLHRAGSQPYLNTRIPNPQLFLGVLNFPSNEYFDDAPPTFLPFVGIPPIDYNYPYPRTTTSTSRPSSQKLASPTFTAECKIQMKVEPKIPPNRNQSCTDHRTCGHLGDGDSLYDEGAHPTYMTLHSTGKTSTRQYPSVSNSPNGSSANENHQSTPPTSRPQGNSSSFFTHAVFTPTLTHNNSRQRYSPTVKHFSGYLSYLTQSLHHQGRY